MKVLSLLFLLIYSQLAFPEAPIVLTEDNSVFLRGEVNDQSIGETILRLEAQSQKSKDGLIYLVIDSPGGSVFAGKELSSYLLNTTHKIECVAKTAISMAFVILQSCPVRHAMTDSISMQHVMSFGSQGREPNVVTFVNFIKTIALRMDQMQAKRIGLSLTEFRNLTIRDWWCYGTDNLDNGIVDDMGQFACSPDLYAKKVTKTVSTLFGQVILNYSACPMVGVPLTVNMKLYEGIKTSLESEKAKQDVLEQADVHGSALRQMMAH